MGGIGVVLTLAYLAVQIRQNTRVVRTSNFQNLMSMNASFTSAIAENEDVADIYQRGLVSFNQLSDTEQIRFNMLISEPFTAAQLSYQLNKRGLIDELLYEGHQASTELLFAAPGVREWWSKNKTWYHADFRDFIDQKLPRAAAQHLSGPRPSIGKDVP